MKKKIILLFLCCIIAVTLVTWSCGVKESAEQEEEEQIEETVEEEEEVEEELEEAGLPYGGTITYVAADDPGSFDNIRFTNTGEQTMTFYLERLFMADWATPREEHAFMGEYISADYARGCLAESWEIPDPSTCIIHLRQGVYWQDKAPVNGREFVASDVVYSYGRQIGKGIAGFEEGSSYQTYPQFANVENIVAQDNYTVVFKLSAPTPLLIDNLGLVDYIKIIPHEVVATYGNMEDWRNAVGTGPFMLKEYISGSQVLFEKNPNYWGYDELHPENRLPYVDSIKQVIIRDPSTSLSAFRTGQVDVRNVAWAEADSLKETNPELLWKEFPVVGYVLAMRNDKPPFNDITVRKAMQMAIDLPTLAEEYYGGNTLGWFPSIIAPSLPDYWTPFEEYPEEVQEGFTYDVTGAKELLAEAGYEGGFDTEIVTSTFMQNDLLEMAQSYLADIGVNAKINVMEHSNWISFVYGKQHQAGSFYFSGSQADPFTALRFYYPDMVWNPACVNDPVYAKLVDDAASEPDVVKRTAKMKEAVYYGMSQFWVVRLPIYVDYVAWHPWLINYQGESTLSTTYNVGAVWARIAVDQELKKELTD